MDRFWIGLALTLSVAARPAQAARVGFTQTFKKLLPSIKRTGNQGSTLKDLRKGGEGPMDPLLERRNLIRLVEDEVPTPTEESSKLIERLKTVPRFDEHALTKQQWKAIDKLLRSVRKREDVALIVKALRDSPHEMHAPLKDWRNAVTGLTIAAAMGIALFEATHLGLANSFPVNFYILMASQIGFTWHRLRQTDDRNKIAVGIAQVLFGLFVAAEIGTVNWTGDHLNNIHDFFDQVPQTIHNLSKSFFDTVIPGSAEAHLNIPSVNNALSVHAGDDWPVRILKDAIGGLLIFHDWVLMDRGVVGGKLRAGVAKAGSVLGVSKRGAKARPVSEESPSPVESVGASSPLGPLMRDKQQ